MVAHRVLLSLALVTVAALGCAGVPTLSGLAVLPAATFAEGPTSGSRLGEGPIHGQAVPFVDAQPVQGFSALLLEEDGTLLVLSDNGFGTFESSADYHLRVYRLRADFETAGGGSGGVEVLGFFELGDPDRLLPYTITNELAEGRVLTGADLDVESFRRAPDGTLWLGDELGPFLVHTDGEGRLLEPPIGLPGPGGDLRSPASPLGEETAAVRLMNAVEAHGLGHGARARPVFSPHHLLVADGDPGSVHPDRAAGGGGEPPPSSDVFDVASLHAAGFSVVPWTVNEPERMRALLALGVDGLITDRPDLARRVLEAFDEDGDGAPDLLDEGGLVDRSRFDLQGHRGARGLRPESTLPAFEAALDALVSTLETDLGLTADGVLVLSHEPRLEPRLCRRRDGAEPGGEAPTIRSLTAAEIQSGYVCDGLDPERFPEGRADPAASPVASAYALERELADPFVMPTLEQLLDFVAYYEAYYREGPGAGSPRARLLADNAAWVRLSVEVKRDPTRPDLTAPGDAFVGAVGEVVAAAGAEERVDVQSFDLGCLLELARRFPAVRAVVLVDDDTLRTDPEGRSPWLAGLRWPYGQTASSHPPLVQASGGIEGMALSLDGSRLLPILEKALVGDDPLSRRIYDFDLGLGAFSGEPRRLLVDPRATSIGDFLLFEESRGLVIERDDREGDLSAFKAIVEVTLAGPGELASSRPLVDLMAIDDPAGLSLPGLEGDVGLGRRFAMPFFTIECLAVLDARHILVGNDDNFPLSVGRHVGAELPDDNELVVVELGSPLW